MSKASTSKMNNHSAASILALISAGQFAAALAAAESALKQSPDEAEVMLLAGVAAAQDNQLGVAAQYWQGVIAVSRTQALLPEVLTQAWFNLGTLFQQVSQSADAEQCYRQALEVDAGNTDALEQLAMLLAAQGRSEDAIDCFTALAKREQPASRHYFNLAVLLTEKAQPEAAIAAYRQALALDNTYAEAWTNLGLLLMEAGKFEEALQAQVSACHHAPASAVAHSNRGLVLDAIACVDEAEAAMQQALTLAPDSARALCNLAVLMAEKGDVVLAEKLFRQSLAVDSDYLTAALYLSNLLLSLGRFEEGWPLYEVRYHPNIADRQTILPPVAYPQWRGETLKGKSIMVWPEQGFGDEIQFCRYLALLKAQGAKRVNLVCRDSLIPLMQSVAGADRLIPVSSLDQGVPKHDYWTFSMSVPQFFPETLPASIPYLKADDGLRNVWRQRLSAEGKVGAKAGALKVGLLWQGNPKHLNDKERSLPGLHSLQPLLAMPGVQFVSLQQQSLPEDAPDNILDLGTAITHFGEAAALIAELDLVISVDSAYAHVAGALGKPCWVMLPRRRTDWRWLRGRNDSPWYPQGMRIFWQPARGQWAPVVDELVSALKVRLLQG